MEWKAIEGFDKYEISDEGQVRNIKSGKVLKPFLRKGKRKVGLMSNGKQHMRYVHLLLAGLTMKTKDKAPERPPEPVEDGTVWKPIAGFEAYQVNELGQIRNARTYRMLRIFENHGFNSVILRRDGKSISVMVHYAVAQTFIPGFNRKTHFVRYANGNRQDNRLENLVVHLRVRDPVIDAGEFAKRKAERERKRLAAYMATMEAKRAARLTEAEARVAAYNRAIAEAAAERKKAKPPTRRLVREKTKKELEAGLSGWLEKTDAGWMAYWRIEGEPQLLGTFSTIGEAARAQRDYHENC
jgi:hypothetical protein